MNWQPCADITTLKQRAKIIAAIREFFAAREVFEVDTPAMSHATVTDVHLQTFNTEFVGPGAANGKALYLQTSPEFHMKRLLCAGSGAIYQICKSFRNEESGRYHNPEFTMLEWYRPGFDHLALMDEMDLLLQQVLQTKPSCRMSYQQAFIEHLAIDPLTADIEQLRELAMSHQLGDFVATEQDKDTLLQLLFCFKIEPKIGLEQPMMIFNFPASQAALAQICPTDSRVAQRFEVYYQGIELANGFHELADANEQLARFEADNNKRQALGLEPQPVDSHLISALHHGLPDCAGVALGIDRLIMLALKKPRIEQVLAFDLERC
jgi:lysyl-tRNA synthetase class 2